MTFRSPFSHTIFIPSSGKLRYRRQGAVDNATAASTNKIVPKIRLTERLRPLADQEEVEPPSVTAGDDKRDDLDT